MRSLIFPMQVYMKTPYLATYGRYTHHNWIDNTSGVHEFTHDYYVTVEIWNNTFTLTSGTSKQESAACPPQREMNRGSYSIEIS